MIPLRIPFAIAAAAGLLLMVVLAGCVPGDSGCAAWACPKKPVAQGTN
jgi:hypothetical protein